VLAEKHDANADIASRNEEQRNIDRGFEMVETGNLLAAKRIFDAALQRAPESTRAIFGNALILRRQNDLPHAIKQFAEVIRSDPQSELGVKAREEFRRIQMEFRARLRLKDTLASIRAGRPSQEVFCFPHLPEPVVLARHLAALSNCDGGVILIGFDAEGNSSGADLRSDFPPVFEAAWLTYCRPPCFFEMLSCGSPNAILIEVDAGPAKPYLVACGDELCAYVCDRSGTLRPATPPELKRLKGIVRS
jgi:hypothetical protein